MRDWEKVLLAPSTSIIRGMEVIDNSSLQVALIVNDDKRLLGTVTDGDIRRGILRGVLLDEPIHKIMHTNPTVAHLEDKPEDLYALMKLKQLRQIPILDDHGRVISVEFYDFIALSSQLDNWVVLMAGGLGTRLQPLTDDCPKPLLEVGGRPILQTILESCIKHGFNRFYLSVNYKAKMVEDYFGNGSRWGVDIRYIREDKRMGTAGALSLLPERPTKPFLVMNGDLLTKVNFKQLLDFHLEHCAQATMCVRDYDFQVPYGVVKVQQHRLVDIEEKPAQKFFVNAGIYVLEPEVLDMIPKDEFYDMPSLFMKLVALHHETIVFPIREYWLDIGNKVDFEQAIGDFSEVFE